MFKTWSVKYLYQLCTKHPRWSTHTLYVYVVCTLVSTYISSVLNIPGGPNIHYMSMWYVPWLFLVYHKVRSFLYSTKLFFLWIPLDGEFLHTQQKLDLSQNNYTVYIVCYNEISCYVHILNNSWYNYTRQWTVVIQYFTMKL